MERVIPAGPNGTIATVDFPFLLDFKSHDVAIADIPGAASLPPGLPSRFDGNALAAYLLANHRRYLALSYDPSTLQDVLEREQLQVGDPTSRGGSRAKPRFGSPAIASTTN
jgi:hypothetical protein